MTTVDRNAVLKALDDFPDPESGRGVVSMEQVHQLTVDGGQIELKLGLTTWSAPLWKETQARAIEMLESRFPGARVRVEIQTHRRPPEKLGEIGLSAKTVVAVGSGKGGVGKSTIAATLAYGLKRAGAVVGLMDADVYGPSIPHLVGSEDRPTIYQNRIQPVVADGIRLMSIGFLVPPEEAVIWRGPMLHNYLTQFLRDTDWGELDYLVVDMPPGTGDVAITLSQLLPLTGAIVVCTPQDVALLGAVKAISMFRKVNIDVLGMVENMSSFICPECKTRHDIFGAGGARRKAEELGVPFLGEVPIDTQLRIEGDEGRVAASFQTESGPYLAAICHRLVKNLAARREAEPPLPQLSIL